MTIETTSSLFDEPCSMVLLCCLNVIQSKQKKQKVVQTKNGKTTNDVHPLRS